MSRLRTSALSRWQLMLWPAVCRLPVNQLDRTKPGRVESLSAKFGAAQLQPAPTNPFIVPSFSDAFLMLF